MAATKTEKQAKAQRLKDAFQSMSDERFKALEKEIGDITSECNECLQGGADDAANLYGTTTYGGYCGQYGCYGTVFELSPSASGWTETVLCSFTDGNDGSTPVAGLVFDTAGNLYGTTSGSYSSAGSVFELSPSSSGWVESTLYTFSGQGDGGGPPCTLVFDAAGNLYGTTSYGGVYNRGGTVFELSPSAGHWTESVLHSFRWK
jgi:uncharacterized repeat protein (TIGR03803 family)